MRFCAVAKGRGWRRPPLMVRRGAFAAPRIQSTGASIRLFAGRRSTPGPGKAWSCGPPPQGRSRLGFKRDQLCFPRRRMSDDLLCRSHAGQAIRTSGKIRQNLRPHLRRHRSTPSAWRPFLPSNGESAAIPRCAFRLIACAQGNRRDSGFGSMLDTAESATRVQSIPATNPPATGPGSFTSRTHCMSLLSSSRSRRRPAAGRHPREVERATPASTAPAQLRSRRDCGVDATAVTKEGRELLRAIRYSVVLAMLTVLTIVGVAAAAQSRRDRSREQQVLDVLERVDARTRAFGLSLARAIERSRSGTVPPLKRSISR